MAEAKVPIHDVLILGAGPCGLAVAARLRETTPSSLFTDSEHQRFHFLRSSSLRTTKAARSSRRSNTAPDRLLSGPPIPSSEDLDLVVLDTNGKWMGEWNTNFEKLGISHLRSPMFFHPDPRDRDGLKAFAWSEGRMDELSEIEGVIGKEMSKHQRKQKRKNGYDFPGFQRRGQALTLRRQKSQEVNTYLDERYRDDYFRPSQALFKDYCGSIVDRYRLSGLVRKSQAVSVSYDVWNRIFTVQTSTGMKKARIVVLAIGSVQKPSLPPDCPFRHSSGSVSHIFNSDPLSQVDIIPPHLSSRLTLGYSTAIAIIGGGLTSAQVAHLAILQGISKVYLILRGPLKTKHFDIDLHWLAKFRNKSMSEFYFADTDEERLEMMKVARGGGSVNPEYKNILHRLVKSGKLEILDYTRIMEAEWDEEAKTWKLFFEGISQELEDVNHIIYATGSPIDITTIPAIQPLLTQHPIRTVGGMPCVTEELMWNHEIPFFVTGKLGGLRLGPAAGNLEGARVGAEFIAGKVAELAEGWRRDEGYETATADGEEEVDMRRLGLGRGNQFDVLGESRQVRGLVVV